MSLIFEALPGIEVPVSAISKSLAQMWAEGPGVDFNTHGHYINMTSTKYTHVFCGFYTLANNTFWGAQDFY